MGIARKIKPIKTKNIRWDVVFYKKGKHVHCESTLERLFVLIADFDPNVIDIEAQPLVIHYNYKKRSKKYFPDFKVYTRDGKIRIVEVKYMEDAVKPENVLKKIVGETYCKKMNWTYQVFTDHQVNPILIDNLLDLRAFGTLETEIKDLHYVFETALQTGVTTINLLRENCSELDSERFYRCVYKLIYSHNIKVDLLNFSLSDQSLVWV